MTDRTARHELKDALESLGRADELLEDEFGDPEYPGSSHMTMALLALEGLVDAQMEVDDAE